MGDAAHDPSVDDGEDLFFVAYLQSMDDGEPLTLDGQADTDRYVVYTTGSQGASRDYVINVLDTGAPDDGVDTLSIYGADSTLNGYVSPGTPYAYDDIFLLRRVTAIAGETATRPAFVALLHVDDLSDAQVTDATFDVERVSYDADLNGRLMVYGLGGNDYFATDDNSAVTTLDGGLGNDTFQIGQVYGLKRDGASVATNDVFATVATTRGWLSAGVSEPLVAVGDKGDDIFTVYSNQAALRLEGGDDNDQFVIRAFALAETSDGEIVWLDEANLIAKPKTITGFSTAAETDIRTGGGQNQVSYNVNAPVSIDGGNGIDKVVVLGTEFADHIVITTVAIYGAGLSVKYANVEVLEVDGLEGDDIVDVLSTAPGVATRVVGGLGSDIVNVAGDVAGAVVASGIEGTSGAVNHDVRSGDPAYDGLVVDGLDLSVARPAAGAVIVTESDGFSEIREGARTGALDSYSVRLAAKPTCGSGVDAAACKVYVTVTAAMSPESEQANGDTFLVSTSSTLSSFYRTVTVDGGTETRPVRSIVLVFTGANWDTPQTVHVFAVNDLRAEGDRVVTAGHSVIQPVCDAADAAHCYDHATVRSVEVMVRDDDLAAVQVVPLDASAHTDTQTLVVEGTSTTEMTDRFRVRLATDPLGAVTVRLTPSDDRIRLSGTGVATITERAPGVPGVYEVTLDSSSWSPSTRPTTPCARIRTRRPSPSRSSRPCTLGPSRLASTCSPSTTTRRASWSSRPVAEPC